MSLFANLFVCVCAFIGFVYGIVVLIKPNRAVFAQMITFAVGCLGFGKLYQIIRIITGGELVDKFQLGVLGVIGSLVFLFSANFGAMDSLADDGGKALRKYRLIALAAPACVVALYVVFMLFTDYPLLAKIMSGVIALFSGLSSYYNLKHLILPDIEFGVIECLRPYNVLALVYSLLSLIETFTMLRSAAATNIVSVLIGITALLIIPTVARGYKKWIT